MNSILTDAQQTLARSLVRLLREKKLDETFFSVYETDNFSFSRKIYVISRRGKLNVTIDRGALEALAADDLLRVVDSSFDELRAVYDEVGHTGNVCRCTATARLYKMVDGDFAANESVATAKVVASTAATNSVDGVLSRRYQVFVSSTYDDLKGERQDVLMALLGMDCIPVGMELFPATPEQWDWIERAIKESDYYAVIVAGRYGSIDPSTGLSFTEREFDYALKIGKPVLGFYHSDIGTIPGSKLEQEQANREKLESFTKKLKSQRICKPWSTSADLKAAVSTAIFQQLKTNPQPGWVRYSPNSAGANITEVLTQMADLKAELRELRTAKAESSPEPFPGSALSEDAKRLLCEAPDSTDGLFSMIRTTHGPVISTHTKNQDFMGKQNDPRAIARWLEAFNELVNAGYLIQESREVYRISSRGYMTADYLRKNLSPTR